MVFDIVANARTWSANYRFPLRRYPAMTPLPDAVYQGDVNMKIVAFCAEETRRQDDTPWHVVRMIDAWQFAKSQKLDEPWPLTHGLIREIGRRVDEENEHGYREWGVTVGGRSAAEPEAIHALISDLLDKQGILSPEDWYYEYELIHPFGDGNGRSGKILLNWLNNSLDNPVWPKDFFGGIANP